MLKNKTSHIFKLLTVLLLLTVIFTLTSCVEGNDPIDQSPEGIAALKSTVLSNMESEDITDGTYASGYLADWGIPSFSTTKFKGAERIYRDYYYKDIPDALTMAKATVSIFFEHLIDQVDLNDEKALTDALIVSYVEAIGDDYSFYRTAVEYDSYNEDMSGEFSGIGVSVLYDMIEGTATVESTIAGSGAEKAGIKPGDIIYSVDGHTIEEVGYNKFVGMIRGEVGTSVKIGVYRGETFIEFDIVRQIIVEESVVYSMDDNKIGYVQIKSFKDNTYDQFKEAIDDLQSKGARGLIFDVRNNPGGYVSSVTSIISYLVPKDLPILQFPDNYANPIYSTGAHRVDLPFVILCNENTASAGEIFVCSLMDYQDMGHLTAVSVGTKTFGKGIMQSSYGFTDGSSITLTVSYYNPPSGINYHEKGITPDIAIEDNEESEEDEQLQAAITEMYRLLGIFVN